MNGLLFDKPLVENILSGDGARLTCSTVPSTQSQSWKNAGRAVVSSQATNTEVMLP